MYIRGRYKKVMHNDKLGSKPISENAQSVAAKQN